MGGRMGDNLKFRLVITDPAETAPIIEPGRAFAVEGRIEATYNSGLFSESDNEEGRISSENMNHTSPVLPSDTILVVELVSPDSENPVDNPNESYSEISQTGSGLTFHDDSGVVVRHTIQTRKNNRNVLAYHPGLTCYDEKLDPGREKMKDYGFPPLMVLDISHPEKSLRNATIKSYFTDTIFKTIIVSATDAANGAILDDGIGYTDENGEPYSALPEGKYRIVVKLIDDGNRTRDLHDDYCAGTTNDIEPVATSEPRFHSYSVLAETHKDITIAYRHDMAIFRVNPQAHRRNMLAWCDRLGVKMQTNLMPGYLNPYLGTWYYHMGLLSMYRANDIAMYSHARVHMFIYLIDPTSTSYETELCYLQTKQVVGDPSLFKAYHYDIGEAEIRTDNCLRFTSIQDSNTNNSNTNNSNANNNDRKGRCWYGKDICFDEGRYLDLCRIDVVNSKASENAYILDGSGVEDVAFMSGRTTKNEHQQEGCTRNDICSYDNEATNRGSSATNTEDAAEYTTEYPDNSAYVSAGTDIAFMGVVRPWQMEPADFFLRRDNTYEIHNSVRSIKYEFEDVTDSQDHTGNDNIIPDSNILDNSISYNGLSGNVEQGNKSALRQESSRQLLMERFIKPEGTEIEHSIGKSVFEFYNIFHVDESYAGRDILVTLTACDKSGEYKPASDRIILHITDMT